MEHGYLCSAVLSMLGQGDASWRTFDVDWQLSCMSYVGPGRAVGLALAFPAVVRAQIAPSGTHYATRPSDTGHDAVGPNQNGGFAPALPLDLPPARGGLPIPLQVAFGTRGFGAAGVGWDIPLSYVLIEQSFAHHRPAYNPGASATPRERVTVALPGRQADMIPQGDDGMHWIARQAPDLTMEYDTTGDAPSYKVFDGRGFTYIFMEDEQHLLDGTGLWLLDSILGPGNAKLKLIHDVNVVNFPDSYPAITIDLSRIQYDSHPSITGCYKTDITLGYEGDVVGASPRTLSTLGLALTARQHKLDYIAISRRATCGATPERIRTYSLTYVNDTDTQLPRLSSVAVSGRDGTPEGSVALPVASYGYGTATVDDGAGGRQLRYQQLPRIQLPTGVKYIASTEKAQSSSDEIFGNPATYVSRQTFTDFTGDGRPDLVFSQNGQLMIARNYPAPGGGITLGTPVPFTDSTYTKQSLDARTSSTPRFGEVTADTINRELVWRQVIDFNGDGRPDIVDASEKSGYWVVYLNKPSSGPSGIQWVRRLYDISAIRSELADTYQLSVPDGYLPLGARATGTNYEAVTCWRLGPDNTVARIEDVWCPDVIENGQVVEPKAGTLLDHGREKTYQEWQLTDVNGDGYPDLLFDQSRIDWVYSDPDPNDYHIVTSAHALYDNTRFALRAVGSSAIRVAYNVAGIVSYGLDTDAQNPFSSSQEFYSNNSGVCNYVDGAWGWVSGGISIWHDMIDASNPDHQVQYQILECSFADVNGDGLIDRVEGATGQRILLGTGSSVLETNLTLPSNNYQIASQRSEYPQHCVWGHPNDPDDPQPDYHAFSSYEETAIRDLTGDGIPDFIGRYNGEGWIGTGGGIVHISGTSIPSAEDEDYGDASSTTQGYVDVDGDGKPEWLNLVPRDGTSGQWDLAVATLTSSGALGAPEAGRIVSVDNGAGAVTSIAYRSAKNDATTLHQVPFPEIVVDHVETADTHLFGGRLARKS